MRVRSNMPVTPTSGFIYGYPRLAVPLHPSRVRPADVRHPDLASSILLRIHRDRAEARAHSRSITGNFSIIRVVFTRGRRQRGHRRRVFLNSRAVLPSLNRAECKPPSIDRIVTHRPYSIVLIAVIQSEDDWTGAKRASGQKSQRFTGRPRASPPSSREGRYGRRWGVEHCY